MRVEDIPYREFLESLDDNQLELLAGSSGLGIEGTLDVMDEITRRNNKERDV